MGKFKKFLISILGFSGLSIGAVSTSGYSKNYNIENKDEMKKYDYTKNESVKQIDDSFYQKTIEVSSKFIITSIYNDSSQDYDKAVEFDGTNYYAKRTFDITISLKDLGIMSLVNYFEYSDIDLSFLSTSKYKDVPDTHTRNAIAFDNKDYSFDINLKKQQKYKQIVYETSIYNKFSLQYSQYKLNFKIERTNEKLDAFRISGTYEYERELSDFSKNIKMLQPKFSSLFLENIKLTFLTKDPSIKADVVQLKRLDLGQKRFGYDLINRSYRDKYMQGWIDRFSVLHGGLLDYSYIENGKDYKVDQILNVFYRDFKTKIVVKTSYLYHIEDKFDAWFFAITGNYDNYIERFKYYIESRYDFVASTFKLSFMPNSPEEIKFKQIANREIWEHMTFYYSIEDNAGNKISKASVIAAYCEQSDKNAKLKTFDQVVYKKFQVKKNSSSLKIVNEDDKEYKNLVKKDIKLSVYDLTLNVGEEKLVVVENMDELKNFYIKSSDGLMVKNESDNKFYVTLDFEINTCLVFDAYNAKDFAIVNVHMIHHEDYSFRMNKTYFEVQQGKKQMFEFSWINSKDSVSVYNTNKDLEVYVEKKVFFVYAKKMGEYKVKFISQKQKVEIEVNIKCVESEIDYFYYTNFYVIEGKKNLEIKLVNLEQVNKDLLKVESNDKDAIYSNGKLFYTCVNEKKITYTIMYKNKKTYFDIFSFDKLEYDDPIDFYNIEKEFEIDLNKYFVDVNTITAHWERFGNKIIVNYKVKEQKELKLFTRAGRVLTYNLKINKKNNDEQQNQSDNKEDNNSDNKSIDDQVDVAKTKISFFIKYGIAIIIASLVIIISSSLLLLKNSKKRK
ncbi:hypothetical protein [Spiroplasma tabanidicola]|uniref:Uncharacterized protein n=1 Tax=Spiroplasma tabanidicola TaxID=324079 RepID=A0A6I6C9V9_9MOLU|nr:hypothetical protein [Spiroplasma tabanidicola]QGS52239.1 hypothetical protein STABA_v1c08840 [Spiroplasma tabanidicola]